MSNWIPDIFVIGGMKCGTSTFYRNLVKNPKLNFTIQKEPNVIIKHQDDQSIQQEYKRILRSDAFPKIDVSPKYSERHIFPDVPEKIHRNRPEAKIIYIVRDPIARVISHLHHDMLRHRITTKDLDHCIQQSDQYILTSSYYYQIKPYADLFGKENVLIMQFEKLVQDPDQFQKDFFQFLQLDSDVMDLRSYNVSERKYLIMYHDPIHKILGSSRLTKAYHLFWYLLNIKVEKPKLSPYNLDIACQRLQADVKLFVEEFNIDTSLWKLWNKINTPL